MTETGGNGAAAVDAGKCCVFRVTAQLQRLLDDRCEVFVFSDVGDARIGDHFGGEDTVSVAGFRRHQTVGGKQDRSRDIGKFLLLIVPGGAEVAFQMWIGLQLWISVSRKHFAVGVNVDTFAFCLF